MKHVLLSADLVNDVVGSFESVWIDYKCGQIDVFLCKNDVGCMAFCLFVYDGTSNGSKRLVYLHFPSNKHA